MKRKMNVTEKFMLFAIGIMSMLMFLPNLKVEPTWENQMKVQGSIRNVQLAVDSFVAKKAIQPTENDFAPTCSIPQKVDMGKLDTSDKGIDTEHVYFLDVHGTVWNEKKENLMTVTKQLDSLVFNHVGASKYEVLEVSKEDCSSPKVVRTIHADQESVIQVSTREVDPTKEYLVRAVFNKKAGMPIGDGFDGRKYQ